MHLTKAELSSLLARTQNILSPFDKAAAMIMAQLKDTGLEDVGPMAIGTRTCELFDQLHAALDHEPDALGLAFAVVGLMIPDNSEIYVTEFFNNEVAEDDPRYERAAACAREVMSLMHIETMKAMMAVTHPELELVDIHPLAPGEQAPQGYRVMRIEHLDEGLRLEELGVNDDGTYAG